MKHPFHQILLYEIGSRLFCTENNCKLIDFTNFLANDLVFGTAEEVWLMGVWKNSPSSQQIARTMPELIHEFRNTKSDLADADIFGSPYSIYDYELDPMFGEKTDLEKIKMNLNQLGKKLILDFVPNHMARDSIFVENYPNLFLKAEKLTDTKNQFLHPNGNIYFHGRDPYFSGWTDTIQWDFSKEETEYIHIQILSYIAKISDGVRCDMAMLLLPDVFLKTHGKTAHFRWERVISQIKKINPNFKFYAEAYWGKEDELISLGFDGAYDKSLYDSMKQKNNVSVMHSIRNSWKQIENSNKKTFGCTKIQFLENHDEERANFVFQDSLRTNFSLLTFSNSIHLIQYEQIYGFKRRTPVQMIRRDKEKIDEGVLNFYARVFKTIQNRKGKQWIEELSYSEFNYKEILALSMESETSYEIFLWNPNETEVSGFLQNVKESLDKELCDILTNSIFENKPNNKTLLNPPMYYKLKPGEAQWFLL